MATINLFRSIRRGVARVLVLTAVAVGLTAGTAVAAPILTPDQPGADILYDAEESYRIGGRRGETELFTLTLAPRGGTAAFLAVLTAAFPAAGWNFIMAEADLTGAFNIDTYDAVGTPTRVGANFDMNYVVGKADVVAFDAGRTFHWIQRVVNNHALPEGHGVPENEIDISAGVGVPFYDVFAPGETVFPTVPPRFQDSPGRTDAGKNHVWSAEVYLVEELAAIGGVRQVRIYNGVNWGWENAVPEPASALMLVAGLGLVVLRRRRRAA